MMMEGDLKGQEREREKLRRTKNTHRRENEKYYTHSFIHRDESGVPGSTTI